MSAIGRYGCIAWVRVFMTVSIHDRIDGLYIDPVQASCFINVLYTCGVVLCCQLLTSSDVHVGKSRHTVDGVTHSALAGDGISLR